MAKFDAATAVEALEYDFTAYGGTAGIIPEPTTDGVQTFFNTLREVAKEIQALQDGEAAADADDSPSDDDAIAAVANMNDNLSEKYNTVLQEALAALCSDRPSKADIATLPYRVLSAFAAWVAEQIRPQQPSGTTR